MRDDGAQMYTGLDQRTLNKRTSDRGSLRSPRSVLSKTLSGASGNSVASVGSGHQLNGAAGTPRGSEYGCARVLGTLLACILVSRLHTVHSSVQRAPCERRHMLQPVVSTWLMASCDALVRAQGEMILEAA